MPIRRLDQTLVQQGFGSRKEVCALIRSRLVAVNGCTAHKGGQKIDLLCDKLAVRGQPVAQREYSYLMLHKPAGVISAARDPQAKTVLDLVPPALRRPGLFPVGRLDKDTTGLLLLTNDGALGHALLAPRRHVPKRYAVTLKSAVTQLDVQAFAGGLRLPPAEGHAPEQCLPAALLIRGEHHAAVVLHEGKYHQIKRMFAALGNEVLALHREAMGALQLDPALPPGACRALTDDEILQLTGDNESVWEGA